MKSKPIPEKKITTILQQDPQSILGFIQKKVFELSRLNEIWQSANPADLVQHTRIANFRDNCLVIEVDNAAWATRLRYLIPSLTKQLVKYSGFCSLKKIEWYIQPRFNPSPEQKQFKPVLTPTAGCLLRNAAENLNSKALQAALTKLSKNV